MQDDAAAKVEAVLMASTDERLLCLAVRFWEALALGHRAAFRLEHCQQLIHMLCSCAEVYWIHPEPSLALQLGG
jgi:hypothetical protein